MINGLSADTSSCRVEVVNKERQEMNFNKPANYLHACLLPALLLAVVLLVGAGPSSARDINDKAGTTGFSFLKIGVGAKAIAMGGAFTALADDPSAIYYNPGATINLENKQFLAGYHNYVLDIQSGFLAATIPFQEKYKLGFFIDYMNYGDFTRTDQYGVVSGDFSGGDFLAGANFSTRIFPELSAGLNVKLVIEYADGYSAEALAADIGFMYKFRDSLTTVGLSAYNLGFVLSGFSDGSFGEHTDDLPMGLRAGVSHSLRELPVIVALDGVLPNDNNPYLNVGLEMYRLKPLYIRAGYSTFGENYKTEANSGALAGFGFGFGLDYKTYQISYAFSPYLDLGSSHRVTVIGGF